MKYQKPEREWEATPNPVGMIKGFGVNQIFRVSRKSAWYCSYQPTTPDTDPPVDETALMHDSGKFEHLPLVLNGDHREKISNEYSQGGYKKVLEYFQAQDQTSNFNPIKFLNL